MANPSVNSSGLKLSFIDLILIKLTVHFWYDGIVIYDSAGQVLHVLLHVHELVGVWWKSELVAAAGLVRTIQSGAGLTIQSSCMSCSLSSWW